MDKKRILEILEGAKDDNGEIPMSLVRKAFDKIEEPCADAVSRQSAIDECNKRGAEHIGYAIAHLPSAQPEQRWIPCSERLPDNDESVLISNSHGVTKAWWNGRFWTSIAVKNYKTVTAWMPLPEPYDLRGEKQRKREKKRDIARIDEV